MGNRAGDEPVGEGTMAGTYRAARALIDAAEEEATRVLAQAAYEARRREHEAEMLLAKARRVLVAAEEKAVVIVASARADAAAPTVLDLDAEVDDLGGGARRVVPTGLEVHFEADGGTGDIVLDGGCVSVDIEPPPGEGDPIDDEFCAGEDPEDLELPEELGDVDISEELREAIAAFQPLRFGLVTVERDGEHFVAPIRTAFDVVFGVTRGLEPEDLEEGGSVFDLLSGRLDDDVSALFDSAFETAFGFEELEDIGEDFEDFEDFEDVEELPTSRTRSTSPA